MGLATEAFVEAAGPDCVIPGQPRPVRIGNIQVSLPPLPCTSRYRIAPFRCVLQVRTLSRDRTELVNLHDVGVGFVLAGLAPSV